jgi:hypothetical protein
MRLEVSAAVCNRRLAALKALVRFAQCGWTLEVANVTEASSMSWNSGAGRPNWLRCAKCRRGQDATKGHKSSLRATGRTRPLSKAQGSNQHSRTLDHRVEYMCLDCDHVGWTRHVEALRLKHLGEEYGNKQSAG